VTGLSAAAIRQDPTDPPARARRSGVGRALRERPQLIGLLLVLPTVAFLVFSFVIPIGAFLAQVFDNRAVSQQLQRTGPALDGWTGLALPEEAAFQALGRDLTELARKDALVPLAARLNHNRAGFRPLITRTGARLPAQEPASWRETLLSLDPRWGELETWRILAAESRPVTTHYMLAALDLQHRIGVGLTEVPPDEKIYRWLFLQTVLISAVVTLLCLCVGLPVAYVLAHGSARMRGILILFVLLPFWSSLLVRSAGWIIVFHDQGMLNYLLSMVGFGPKATALLYDRPGVYVAMTHVLLPFMILPIFSVMRSVPDTHLKAAASLGAPPLLAFRRVYLPQVAPGIVAGCTLVFISALGYYITPMLVGGPKDQMISYFIAYFTNVSVNWGMGGALSLVLLGTVAVIYLLLGRLVGFDAFKLR
jgi:putative spermidine/putrescine transport system permease protein